MVVRNVVGWPFREMINTSSLLVRVCVVGRVRLPFAWSFIALVHRKLKWAMQPSEHVCLD